MLTYDMENRGTHSLYEYLALCIRKDIMDGTLSAGTKLPSKRSLAANLDVSVITVENAYAQLAMDGFISTEEKKGYFVNRLDYQKRRRKPGKKVFQSKYAEDEYFADLCANKTPYEYFPYSTWARLMREVLTTKDDALLKPVPFNGIENLRSAVAGYLYGTRGMEVSPDCIVIGAGVEYLYGRLVRLLGKNSLYAVEDPGYSIIDRTLEGLEVRRRHIPVDEEGIRPELLEESGADIVHISPSSQFPMGSIMPGKRRRELLKWAAAKPGRYIVEDDFDCEFRIGGRPVPSLYSLDENDRVIYMNTFSKSLTPAIRVSYMILPEELMERYVSSLSFYTCTVSSFEQFTLEKFIRGGYLERHVLRLNQYYRKLRRKILEEIKRSGLEPLVSVQTVGAATQLLLHLHTDMTDKEILRRGKEQGLHLMFLTQHCRGKDCMVEHVMVLNYSSVKEENLPEMIRRLKAVLAEEPEEKERRAGKWSVKK